MPKNKNLKRLIRARMARTCESYVTARAAVLRGLKAPEPPRDWRHSSGAFGAAPDPVHERLVAMLGRLGSALGWHVEDFPTVPREWAEPRFRIVGAHNQPFYLDTAVATAPGKDARRWIQETQCICLDPVRCVTIPGVAPLDLPPSAIAISAQWLARWIARPHFPLTWAVGRSADRFTDPDRPYVVAIAAKDNSVGDQGVIDLWAGPFGPRLHVSAVLVVNGVDSENPIARLYHHPEPRRPVAPQDFGPLPTARWGNGRYLHLDGQPLAALLRN